MLKWEKLRLKWAPLPKWAKETAVEVQSVLSLTPVVLFLLIVVLCFLWYDVQNRFMNQTKRILESQNEQKVAIATLQRTEANTQQIQANLKMAQTDVLQIEENSRRINQLVVISRDALARVRETQQQIEGASKDIAQNAANAVRAATQTQQANREQNKEQAERLNNSTEEILRNLTVSQHNIEHRLDLLQDKLQKVIDHNRK